MPLLRDQVSRGARQAYKLFKPPRLTIHTFGKEWRDWRVAWADLLGGLTVGVFLIPQGLALGKLAGLPPINGLYSAIIPLYIYTFFATSRQGALGPVALNAVLTGELLRGHPPEARVPLVMAVTLLVGLFKFAGALLRLGFLVNLLSESVIGGFSSAAGLQIALQQVPPLLGLPSTSSSVYHAIIIDIINGLRVATLGSLWAALMGVPVILILLYARRVIPRIPSWFPLQLVLMVICILITWLGGLDRFGIAIVGNIPKGFPIPGLPPLAEVPTVISGAFMLTIISYMGHISATQALAKKLNYTIDANQELYAGGLANVGAAFFGAMPTCCGFARTALAATAGVRTPLAGLFAASLVLLTVLFLTPLFWFLPSPCLAAIIIATAVGLIDIQEPIQLGRQGYREDVGVWCLTFLGTGFLGIQLGLGIAVILSWLLALRILAAPKHAVLGRVPGTTDFRAVGNFPDSEVVPGVLIWRFDSPLFFANVQMMKETVAKLVQRHAPQYFVLDARCIIAVDASAGRALEDTIRSLRAKGIHFAVTHLRVYVRRAMSPALLELIGEAHIFLDNHSALEWCQHHREMGGAEGAAGIEAVYSEGASVAGNASIGDYAEEEVAVELETSLGGPLPGPALTWEESSPTLDRPLVKAPL